MASRFDEEEKPTAKVVALPVAAAKPEPDFPYTWIGDAVLKLDTRPLIKGIIDPGAFGLIYGPSGSGKSFFTADIAQHVAQGNPWRGRKVNQGLVVYVASEAGSSILKRFVGWRDNRLGESVEKIPLAVLTRGPNLLGGTDFSKFTDQLKALVAEAEMPLALVIFDTLSRSIPGGDENKAEDMTMAVLSADRLRDEFNCATIFVHHTGKDPEKGARGHSSLRAAADMVMLVMDKAATVEKVRDGVAGEKFGFELQPIEIGTDSDGDAVYTCLLNASDQAAPKKRPEPTGKNQRIVLKEVRAIAPTGDISPGTSQLPKGVRLIRFNDLVDKASPRFAGMELFRARARISEALTSLQASGFVGVHGDYLWLT